MRQCPGGWQYNIAKLDANGDIILVKRGHYTCVYLAFLIRPVKRRGVILHLLLSRKYVNEQAEIL